MAHRVLAIFRRRLFTGLTILSLLLCLATVALWVRSYWRYDLVAFVYHDPNDETRNFGMQSGSGELRIFDWPYFGSGSASWRYATDSTPQQTMLSSSTKLLRGAHALLGFGSVAVKDSGVIWFPHWFPALLFAILPAFRLRSILRTRRRHRIGLCSHCGYDLRATPQGGRCPECGEVAPTPR